MLYYGDPAPIFDAGQPQARGVFADSVSPPESSAAISLSETGHATEHATLRPIPKGKYKVFVNNQPSPRALCDYNPEAT